MKEVPLFVDLILGFTVVLAVGIFYRASNYSKFFLILVTQIAIAQLIGTFIGFYQFPYTGPPRFPLLILPSFIAIIILFANQWGRNFIDKLNLKTLTIFHSIRILVELVLYGLYLSKALPSLLTFEGRNFDIISGLSAPIVYYFGFVKKRLNKLVLLCWNFICLGLLVNVVYYALLSTPSPFQKFGFDQPNIALGYFPFMLIPSILVPMVFLAHFASIRQLIKK